MIAANIRSTSLMLVLLAASVLFPAAAVQTSGGASAPFPVRIKAGEIGGVIRSSKGPEAGVWVIAETTAFPTRFAKIVVTDDAGRYLVPDLPPATYSVWVRGYGLEDSPKVTAKPGTLVNLTVLAARNAAVAAKTYPAAYWYALMRIPTEQEVERVPGGRNGYLMWVKNMGCVGCHQLGNLATRTLPKDLGTFPSSQEAWVRRISSGQAGRDMVTLAQGVLGGVPIKYLADWTDRIAAGAVPVAQPHRPAGLERNVVATVRDWASPTTYLHDLSGTDQRHPTVNAYGPLYGSPELSTDDFPILDPAHNLARTFRAPVRDADTPSTHDAPALAASPYWGDQRIWASRANAHNPMLDERGRVWYTARIRGATDPAYCGKGSSLPFAEDFPLDRSDRQVAVYEPKSGRYTFVDTCYGTHHLRFAEDAGDTLWTSGARDVVGWVDTKKFDALVATKGPAAAAEAAQGWAPFVLDTNGNGKRDEWTEPGQPQDPQRDTRISASFYAVMPDPADGSVWGSVAFRYPGAILRFDPPTKLSELYEVPPPGFGVRGADIDRNGVVWVSLASGHLGRFDRRLCKGPLNGPKAMGKQCPEGWRFYRLPGPSFRDVPDESVESSYYTWVDQHDTLGLGTNVPIATGNLYDGVHALVRGRFVTLRIPYPLGFYAKGMEGRIDDPSVGWKGRGLWVTEGDRTPWHKEGGKGSKPIVVHFQMRPDPLAD